MAKPGESTSAPKAPAGGKGGAPRPPQQQRGKGAPAPDTTIAKTRPKSTGQTKPRLKEHFLTNAAPALMKERGYTNGWQVPPLDKIVINMGVGEGRDNAKILDFATADLQLIAGQKPVVTKAKKIGRAHV